MSEQENTTLVKQTYEFFKGGDIQSLLGLYSDDIDWQLPKIENVPFAGDWRGREKVGEFFSLVNELQEALQFEPTEFIAQGDKVVVLGNYTWRLKANGKEFSSDFAHVCTVKDGKIVRFHEYTDTAAASKAYAAAQAQTA
jgi:ketosteroid isomerase-like protein